MVFAREQAVLANLKAVASGYPLRGEVQIRTRQGVKQGTYSPAPGEVWADARLLQKMGLQLGDGVRLGSRSFVLAAEVLREPDGAVDVFNFIPRVLLNHADLAATGLVQDGSRIRYRLLAGWRCGTGQKLPRLAGSRSSSPARGWKTSKKPAPRCAARWSGRGAFSA